MSLVVVDLVSHFTGSYFDHVCQLSQSHATFSQYVEMMTTPIIDYTYFLKYLRLKMVDLL